MYETIQVYSNSYEIAQATSSNIKVYSNHEQINFDKENKEQRN